MKNVDLYAEGLEYGTAATEARNDLTENRGWNIIGDEAGSGACDALVSLTPAIDQSHDPLYSMEIYPNPSEGAYFNIRVRIKQTVQILDVSGRRISEWTLDHGDNRIPSVNIKPGVYFIRSETGIVNRWVKIGQ